METHELPDELNPTGDKCYPLFIPDDPQWRQLILGIIHQLADENYYRDLAFVPNDVAEVCEQWIQRTLIPLVHAMNDASECIDPVPETYQLFVERVTSTQSLLAAGSPNAIIWNGGSFDISNPTQFPCPDDGLYTISSNFRLSCVNSIGWEVRLRKNGTDELMRISHVASTLWQVGFSYQFHAFSGDYIELLVAHSQNAVLNITAPLTKCFMLVIPDAP